MDGVGGRLSSSSSSGCRTSTKDVSSFNPLSLSLSFLSSVEGFDSGVESFSDFNKSLKDEV